MDNKQQEERLTRQRKRAQNAIKVKELCYVLNNMPSYIQDLPIVIDYDFVENIRIVEDFPLGDPAHPYGCEYCKVIQLT